RRGGTGSFDPCGWSSRFLTRPGPEGSDTDQILRLVRSTVLREVLLPEERAPYGLGTPVPGEGTEQRPGGRVVRGHGRFEVAQALVDDRVADEVEHPAGQPLSAVRGVHGDLPEEIRVRAVGTH